MPSFGPVSKQKETLSFGFFSSYFSWSYEIFKNPVVVHYFDQAKLGVSPGSNFFGKTPLFFRLNAVNSAIFPV